MSIDAERVRSLFFAALDQPREALESFLAQSCGDDEEMLREVRSLLGHHDERSLILGDPIGGDEPDQAEQPDAQQPGDDQDQRYRTLDALGQGGFGRVERCFDRSLRRMVAVKAPIKPDGPVAQQLLHEARLLAYLDHPGVVQVYDVEGAGASYTMRLLDGESLKDRLAHLRSEGQAMPLSEALRIVTRLCETMANAHDKGVLHLDLKPANVMLLSWGQVSIIDWGISRFFDPTRYAAYLSSAGEAPVTAAESAPPGGTPSYMPAEQFRADTEALGPTADIYAIGAVLFELLTGAPAFGASPSLPVLVYKKSTAPPPDPADVRTDVPRSLGALCTGMLAARPEDRPQSFLEILDALAALADGGSDAEVIELADGDVLFEAGDAGATAYQILSGGLAISMGGSVIATRRSGDIVGELAILSNRRRTATARAAGETRVRRIDWNALEQELAKVNPLIGRIMRSLSDKLVETTTE